MQIIHTYANRLRGLLDDVTDMLFLDNRNQIAKSGVVHHSPPTQTHRCRRCRRIRGGIC